MLQEMDRKAVTAQHINVPRVRRLPFSGAKNFRDLGGYRTRDGRLVRWGALYRSDALHKLTDADLRQLSDLSLEQVIDFRAIYERDREPDRLPEELKGRLLGIPILDSSTELFQNSRQEFVRILRTVDASQSLINTNVELATRFAPEIRRFIDVLLSSNGRPVLFHCAAGKDRTGFAAAIVLRIFGVSQDVVMEDYLLTNRYFFSAYGWSLKIMKWIRGKRFAESVRAFMMAEPAYLSAAFQAIDENYGSFDYYVRDGLGLSGMDVEHLQRAYLE